MDIRKARKIAEKLDSFEKETFRTEDLHDAFHRLDRSGMKGNKEDLKLARKIWMFVGNREK